MDGRDFLAEFDTETANTRRVLERLPEDGLDFTPHPKSWDLRTLASHVANLPSWMSATFQMDELDMAQPFDRNEPETKDEILAEFERIKDEARDVLEGVTAQDLASPWTLRSGDEVHFTMPKGVVLRQFVLNHIVHHRGQLNVYLRLLDVPVPGIYGPSADETM